MTLCSAATSITAGLVSSLHVERHTTTYRRY